MSRYVLHSCFVVFVAMAVLFAASGVAMGDLLFSDDFNNAGAPVATDYALNANLAGRLGGYLAPSMQTLAWGLDVSSLPGAIRVNETTGAWNGANAMVAQFTGANPHHGAIIQHNFNDAYIAAGGWFSVRFDYTPVYSADTTSSTAVGGSVFIGGNSANGNNIGGLTPGRFDTKCDLSINFLGDGRIKATFAGLGNGGTWSTFDTAPGTITAPKTYSLELTVTLLGNSFAQGTSASANLKWLDNSSVWSSIDLNGAAGGTDVSWVWDADGTNYMGFSEMLASTRTQYCKWDNVSVNGEVPEPSTLALLAAGLIGLLAYAWWKRK